MNIYISHPMTGLSGNEVLNYFEDLKNKLEQWGYFVYCPTTGKYYLRDSEELQASGYKNAISNNHAITERDHWMVSQTDIVFVDFSNSEKVSIGCIAELSWAYHLNKHVVLILPKNNIHTHAFVLEMADIIFENINEGLEYLQKMVNQSL